MIGVIADDLTGAAECAAPCHEHGLRTALLTSAMPWPHHTDALVIDTDTRHVAPAVAEERVAEAMHNLRQAGCAWVMKKTDSTLRGHIAVEIAACRRIAGSDSTLFAPAHPEAGRCVRDGHVLLDGVPLHLGPLRHDPTWPIQNSDAIAMLRRGGLTCRSITPGDTVSTGPEAVLVADAETPDDLDRVCRALDGQVGLHAGSSALLAALLRCRGYHRQAWSSPTATGPWWCLRGSLHPTTLSQTAEPDCALLPIPADTRRRDRLLVDLLHAMHAAWNTGTMPCLAIVDPIAEGGAEASLRLAKVAAQIKQELPSSNLVVCGGMTARALIDALPTGHLHPLGMPRPGLCYHSFTDRNLLITKSGGMGGHDCMRRILRCDWA